jgi:ADP-ribose pyrophosphatase YjhB (NUDIX family)
MVKLCIKCGLEGHTNRSCKGPVTSFGLVVFAKGKENVKKGRIYSHQITTCSVHNPNITLENSSFQMTDSVPNEILFLLVERKDTVGFLNIIQGSYPDIEPYKSKKINRYINELTCEERCKLVTWDFAHLWKVAGSDKKDANKAQLKFSALNIQSCLNNSTCLYEEADYLMPKGRLKYGESTKQCALREFSEETGYNKNDVELFNINPYSEQFIGTDGKMYRNVFYVARLKDDAKIMIQLGDDPNQSKEVRNLGWFNLTECHKLIRDYHQDKKDILSQVHSWITKETI